MIRSLAAILFFLALLIPAQGHGQTSCLPESTAAQTFWRVGAGEPLRVPLSTRRGEETILTRVYLEGDRDGETIRMKVRFDPDFQGVSLPYNLYAVLVIRNGAPFAWWDFTSGCEGSGLSFFPGQEILLPKVKTVGDKADRLQIMVWGRL